MNFGRYWTCGLMIFAGGMIAACGGPRTDRLTQDSFKKRPRLYPIETFVGEVEQSHREIAVIESDAFSADDEVTKKKQLEQLQRKARALGADAVHEIRILTKEIKGYTIDERVPFPAWKQGEYPLYFMRGTAIIYSSGLPGAVARGQGFTSGPEGYIPPKSDKPKEKKPASAQ